MPPTDSQTQQDPAAPEAVHVQTVLGTVAGANTAGICRFKGIPYAAAPTGAGRWQPPSRIARWEGIRPAQHFGTVAPQGPSQPGLIPALNIPGERSEDCLFLNIFTPAADPEAKLPVFFWIHGGGFLLGSGSQPLYDGSSFAAQNHCVVVTINYRLGPLGFLRLADITDGAIKSSGNEGLLDMVAALEWVQENIAPFGGDPSNVTIAGESAGGFSVGCLLAMPRARGLFARAIAQSGAASTAAPVDQANEAARALLAALGIPKDQAEDLHQVPWTQLLAATGTIQTSPSDIDRGFGVMPFQPVIDGDVLPGRPLELIRSGNTSPVPLLVGTTRDEWNVFIDESIVRMPAELLPAQCASRVGVRAAKAILDYYHGDKAPVLTLSRIETDRVFAVPALELLSAQGRIGAPVYRYRVDWSSPALGGALGAGHTAELGLVFGTFANPNFADFYGDGHGAEEASRAMQAAWGSFCRTGIPDPGDGLVWPVWSEDDGYTMIFDSGTHMERLQSQKLLAVWRENALASIGQI